MDIYDLHTATALGDLSVVEMIVKRSGKPIDKKNFEGWTALMYACYMEHVYIAQLLIRSGASTLTINNAGQTLMMFAASNGNLTLMDMVFEANLLEQRDDSGWTALYYAVEFKQIEAVRYLLSRRADVNAVEKKGLTPLMSAAKSGSGTIAQLLLSYGADKHLLSHYGITARDLALKNRHNNVAQLLEVVQVISDLKAFLENLGLEKYWPVFKQRNINLQQFLTLREDDLKTLGIVLLGPRRRMALAIAHFNGTN